MRLLSQQDARQLRTLLDAVPSDPSESIGVRQIADKAGMPAMLVEQLLRQHPRYFVNVGGKNVYSLNRLGAHRGTRAKIAADIECLHRESALLLRLRTLAPVASLAAPAGVVVAVLLGRQQWAAAFFVAMLPSILFVIGAGVAARQRRSG